MKINFVLPLYRNPSGGYKVIYEYANKLNNSGFCVNIIFVNNLKYKEKKIFKNCLLDIKYFYIKQTKKYMPTWFRLEQNINCYLINKKMTNNLMISDYTMATAATTADFVNSLPELCGKKYYFIQSYENWMINEDELIETWKMPMKKIVISKSLLKKAEELGEQATYIPNGLNQGEFFIDSNVKKEENTLMMLYHSNESVKQSNKALEKLVGLKKSNPEIKLILFSTLVKPTHIPEWVEYYQLPDKALLRKLYNRATLFIAPSAIEGWALPPAEAMMCGTAVCVTEIDGHEYVKDGETGYLINSDLSNLVTVVKKILTDSIKLDQTAKNGNEYIKQFTWEKSIEKFIEVIE